MGGGEFRTYGIQVASMMQEDPEDRVDPMARVFPRVTKCTFKKFGPSGTLQTHDSLCVLPVNIINEKIYVFLWFWLLILGVITFLSLIYNIIYMIYFLENLRVPLVLAAHPWGCHFPLTHLQLLPICN